MVHLKKISILLLVLTVQLFPQTKKDTTDTGLDSLMSLRITNERYVSTASRYSQMIEEAPTSATIVNSNSIERFGYNSLSELLRSVRGLYNNYDRQYERLGVRGFNRPADYNNRVLILFNGHRLNIYDGAPVGNDLGFDMFNIDRVEIIRGPGSALYGTNAMLAVINIFTKKMESIAKPEIKGSYGSFNSKKISLNWGGNIFNDLKFDINSSIYDSKGENVYFQEFDTKEKNNGLATGLDYESYFGFHTSISYKDLYINGFSTFRRKGNPTGSFYSKFNKKSENTDLTQFIELNYSYPISYDKFLEAKASYDSYDHDGIYYIQMFGFDGEGLVKNIAKTLSAEAQFIWDILPNNRLISGIEYRHELEKIIYLGMHDQDYLDVDSPSKILSVYIQNEYQFSNSLSFYLGIRHDSYSPGSSSTNPRISLNYALNDQNIIRAIYGTAFREPGIHERDYEIPFLFKKNPNLTPENINTAELIWEFNISNFLKSTLSLYHYKMSDLIDNELDLSDMLFQYQNIGTVTTNGLEMELNADLSSDFSAFLSYSYQKSTDQNDQVLSSSPEHLLKAGITAPIIYPINLSSEVHFETERYSIYRKLSEPVLYGTLNLFTNPILGGFKFSISARNLFNQNILYPGGFQHTQNWIPQQGRSYLLSISYVGN